MPSPITLKDHLTTDEWYPRYRKCQQPREKLRWRALYLIAKGGIANRVAKQAGRSSGWMTNLARRYNELGAAGVPDQRASGQANQAVLCEGVHDCDSRPLAA